METEQKTELKAKKAFPMEAAYAIGQVTIAFGTALMARADFGVSMVVAPAYLVYLKLSESISWFSFGLAEYLFQALLLLVTTAVIGKFKKRYLFAVASVIIYGALLDLFMLVAGRIPTDELWVRIIIFAVGSVTVAVGVAFMFNTYLSPEVYELAVKEIAEKFGFDVGKTKTVYDVISLVLAVAMSFLFFGWRKFEGIGYGTLINALTNGPMITVLNKLYRKKFEFVRKINLKKEPPKEEK